MPIVPNCQARQLQLAKASLSGSLPLMLALTPPASKPKTKFCCLVDPQRIEEKKGLRRSASSPEPLGQAVNLACR